jgi:hypothetical protein
METLAYHRFATMDFNSGTCSPLLKKIRQTDRNGRAGKAFFAHTSSRRSPNKNYWTPTSTKWFQLEFCSSCSCYPIHCNVTVSHVKRSSDPGGRELPLGTTTRATLPCTNANSYPVTAPCHVTLTSFITDTINTFGPNSTHPVVDPIHFNLPTQEQLANFFSKYHLLILRRCKWSYDLSYNTKVAYHIACQYI